MEALSIHIQDLTKSFRSLRGSTVVLTGIDLKIAAGEFFVLLGPSGCGKSTLLNMIAGLEQPTRGRVMVGRRVVVDTAGGVFVEPARRGIAMVFQSYALYPHMTVRENIAFPLTNLKPRPSRDKIAARVERVASRLQVGSLLDRKPAELSGGQRQRVAIGRALVREPRVLLMDEPLSNLDARLRLDMRAQLKELQRALGITAVYVTHDQIEAMTLGDRMAVLSDGVIQQCATPLEVYDHPVNVCVAQFVGSPPMNLLRGTLAPAGDDPARPPLFRTGALAIQLPVDHGNLRSQGPQPQVILGVRPEHVRIAPAAEGGIHGAVRVIENLGTGFLVHLNVEGHNLVALSEQAPAASTVTVRFAPGRLHLFPASGDE